MNILDRFKLDGKVAIITGASRGIGEAMAQAFGQAGAKVVISSRKQEALDEVAQRLQQEGLEVEPIAAHNGKVEDLEKLLDKTVARFGKLDILVNNAATNPAFGPIMNTEEAAFDKIMEVNVKGMFELSKKAHAELKKNQGNIINISSVAGIRPDEKTGIYSVSKAAVISLTRVMARDWAPDGIRVNAICPGLIRTKMSEALWKNEAVYNQIMHFVPMKRIGEPEEMATLAIFLASEAGAYCTGGAYVADGGLLS